MSRKVSRSKGVKPGVFFVTISILLLSQSSDAQMKASAETCIKASVRITTDGKVTFKWSKRGKARIRGLGRMLSGIAKRASRKSDSKAIKKFLASASQYAKKIPNDAGYRWYLNQRLKVTADERAYLDYVFDGKVTGWVKKAKFVGSILRKIRITKKKFIYSGYTKAGINYSILPLIKVDKASSLIIYMSGRKGPSRVPLMRVEAGTKLVWLNKDKLKYNRYGKKFCRVLVYNRWGRPLFGWIQCEPRL